MNPRTLLLRADANIATGTGHVMRCLALAQAWQDAGGHAVFVSAESTAAIRERLLAESCEVLSIAASAGSPDDSKQTIALARENAARWIVVDGYQFTAEYQRALKSAGCKTLFFDDYGHAERYSADLVVNQNAGADENLYRNRDSQTRLLLGPKYCILRREFNAWREWTREIQPAGHRVLVTMGGSDPENVTARAMAARSQMKVENLEVTVVVGGSNPNFESLQRAAAQAGSKITVLRDVSNIAELMAWADVALSAAGSTCWELCLLGLPALLVDVADNQTAVARELDRRGCAVHLGNSRHASAEKIAGHLERLLKSEHVRRSLSGSCRELVDGEGAARVVSALRGGLRLRPAQPSDIRLLWELANDPQVRAAAFSSDPIPWERHEIWFASKMKDRDCRILIAEDETGSAIGQFRVDWRSPQDGAISVSLSRDRRGAGHGTRLIESGVEAIGRERAGARLHAFVKPENQPSRRAFEAAGFRNLGEDDAAGHRAVHYIYESVHS